MELRVLARWVVLLGVFVVAPCTHVRAETAEEVFSRANEAYADGRYDDAVSAYESLLLYRVRDPVVEYNLAGALFRQDRRGEAILHYERAVLLAPNDREIRENLEYAKSFCLDRIDPEPVPASLAYAIRLQNGIGTTLHGWLALGLWWLLLLVIVVGLARRDGFKARIGWILAILVLLLALTGASWYVTWKRLVGTERAVVQVTAVEVLGGPGRNNATLFTVHEGLTVELRDERNDWSQVSLSNGLSGWLPSATIESVR
ncbi:MAG: tetratricopeptide repeat protein [Acidobacteriota bacterium]|nr:tetratricopeptide repeat protein [Acidobacteriota bacterium]